MSQWPLYKTKNGDTLDQDFFNGRLRNIDQRLVAVESVLGTIESGSQELIQEVLDQIQSSSEQALVDFNFAMATTLSTIQNAEATIQALSDEVNGLLGNLGTEFQVDCENGSKVQLRRSSTPGVAPSAAAMDPGELYLNLADGKMFYEDASGAIVEVNLNTTGASILARLLDVDGNGSGLDADTIDGEHASSFAPASHIHSEYMPKAGGTVDGTVNIHANSNDPALKVRQVGSGDALRVETELDDPSPFRVDAEGVVHCTSLVAGSQPDSRAGIAAAPNAAKFIVQTPDAELEAAQALSALATGLLKNTTGTGVLSAAVAGTDYFAPGGTDIPVADGGTGVSTHVEHALLIGNGANPVQSLAPGANGQLVKSNGTNPIYKDDLGAITFVIDNGTAAITTGYKGEIHVPYNCEITGWALTSDVVGSIVISPTKYPIASFPSSGTALAPSAKPTLSSARTNDSTNVGAWVTSIDAGNVIGINVDSVATVKRVTLTLYVKKL